MYRVLPCGGVSSGWKVYVSWRTNIKLWPSELQSDTISNEIVTKIIDCVYEVGTNFISSYHNCYCEEELFPQSSSTILLYVRKRTPIEAKPRKSPLNSENSAESQLSKGLFSLILGKSKVRHEVSVALVKIDAEL